MKKPTGIKKTPAGPTKQGHCATTVQAVKPLALVPTKAEPRVDSRLLAQHLGNKHRPTMALIEKHRERFESFGKVLFQKAPSADSRTGQRERYACLNEDQALFLLTLSRNTERVVELKLRLIKAFGEARRAAVVRQTEYLPGYHALQDSIHTLAQGSPNERFLHMNVAKLVNKAAGIEAGQRLGAPLPKQSLLAVAHMLAAAALQGATDRYQIQGRVKAALAPLASLTTMHALEAAP